jgi:putative cardiolipin synthase
MSALGITPVRRRVRSFGALLCAATFAALVSGCATLPREVPAVSSHAWEHPEETPLGREYARQLAEHPGQSGFHVLDDGREAFLARAALAASAQRTLDLQYYYVGEDATADILLYRAVLAAKRGVRVRLLLDDLYAARRDFDLALLSGAPNIQVRVFNPFVTRGPPGLARLFELLGDPDRLERRMHNKLWIADNAVAIVGGRNLGDQYFAAPAETSFADLDLLAAGPVVQVLSRAFDDYWNSAWAVPAEAFLREAPSDDAVAHAESALAADYERFSDSDYARAMREAAASGFLRARNFALIPAPAEVLWDRPGESRAGTAGAISEVLVRVYALVESAQHEVILISPYYIPVGRGLATLAELVRRGVRVRVLTNSLASTDVPVALAAYARYRGQLVGSGVELYEQKPNSDVVAASAHRPSLSGTSLHAKAIVVDRTTVIVGSMNLDPLSHLHNTEVAVVARSPALGEQLGKLFDDAVLPTHSFVVTLAAPGRENGGLVWIGEEDGKVVHYETDPLAGFWRRLSALLLGLLAPEDLL